MDKLPTPEPTTFNVVNLSSILDDDQIEDLTTSSRFSWGDTDVTMVTLVNLLKECDRVDITVDPTVESLPDDTYVNLNG